MGQSQSCSNHHHNYESVVGLFGAVANGELEVVEAILEEHPTLLEHTTGRARLSPLHVAAANGRVEVSLPANCPSFCLCLVLCFFCCVLCFSCPFVLNLG